MVKKRKLHIGDVIENLWASKENPHRFGVIKLIDGKYIYMVLPGIDLFDYFRYYKFDVINDVEHFIVRGHIDMLGILMNEINKIISQ